MEITFKIEANPEIIRSISKRTQERLRKVVSKTAFDVQAATQDNIRLHDLIDTGFMLNSVNTLQVSPYSQLIIVSAFYAIYHELGTVNLPAKPFLAPAVEAMRKPFLEAVRQAVNGNNGA
jgi:hypothetical protein